MHTKLFALVAAVGMLGLAVGPGVAAAAASDSGNAAANEPLNVSVTQEMGVSISVTQNGTDVENATVDVAVVGNGSYDEAGTHTTNENGAILLSPPEEDVTIDVTASANNQTATTTASLTGTNGTDAAFGHQVSWFVQKLLGNGETDIGQQVSEFVRANNPGNAPDHAGPPAHAGPGDGNESVDENESANETNGGNGPPAHAGGPDEGDGDAEGSASGNGNGGGPPAHAGPGDDADEEDDADE
ncbi:hypothetical protein SAMN05216559_3938 [Halomicrobium zhouii]|uniref:Uncharacterized protein n=1 Tax=Halomicrobium zhouii TaxID=767519 RepID=A0A1I6M7T0_9EURY|nr:hypothetical protein [Halomicrobium zhouii]SFS11756.1 hypothetical protein SAMN05216559_3938 [Halomicrobium zhouii]